MSEALALAGIAMVGTVFWVVSPEVSAVYYAKELGWPALGVGVVVAAAQLPVYFCVYLGGERLVARWAWLRRQVVRARARHERRMARNYLGLTAVAAVLGVPPVLVMCALGGPFGVNPRHLLPVVALGRLVRFTTLAGTGGLLT